MYQGEELGLPEVADLPLDRLRDPMWERTGHASKGRDGCRVPLPWTSDGPSFGFGPGGSWLPQPPDWGRYAAQAQQGVADSFLELYRAAIRLRRSFRGDERFAWLPVADESRVLAFRKGAGLVCVVNFADHPVALPPGEVLLTSDPLVDGQLPGDTAAWLRG